MRHCTVEYSLVCKSLLILRGPGKRSPLPYADRSYGAYARRSYVDVMLLRKLFSHCMLLGPFDVFDPSSLRSLA
jgi:hypothetical protein